MPIEDVTLVDGQGNESAEAVTLEEPRGGDRMIHVFGALWTRHGNDDEGRKKFVFERTQRS